MSIAKVLVGFVPLVVFSLCSTLLGVRWACVVALVVAVGVTAATARGGIKTLPAAQSVILLAMTVLAFTGGDATVAAMTRYAPALHGLLLGLFMLATAATIPFTSQYARTTVPEEVWHTQRFHDVNQRISTAWGLAVVVEGLFHLAAAEIPASGGHLVLRLAVNWVLPVGAILWATVYTQRTVASAKQAAQDHHPEIRSATASGSASAQHGAHEAGQVRA